jgi:hypothetical protein
MRRILVVVLGAGLVLAPAAVAKGPHAVLTSGPEAVMPGVPWEATVELNEFRETPRPLLMGLRDHGHVDAKVRKVAASIDGALGFKTTMVFPTAGRWKLMLIAGKHRFNLPTLSVGTGEAPKDWVAFPVGSYAARQGGGGELITGEQSVDTTGGDSLPPEVITATDADSGDDDGGGTPSWWLFPLAGIVIAGAGVATIRARR